MDCACSGMGEKGEYFRSLIGKPIGKDRLEDSNVNHVQEMVSQGVELINLFQDRSKRLTFVYKVLNFGIL
jgi:hypothetical protein